MDVWKDTESHYNERWVRERIGFPPFIVITIKGLDFKFDEKGLKFFKKAFKCSDFHILTIHNGYLARRDAETGRIQYFHRTYKLRAKERMTDLIIHHRNGDKKDNRIANLKVMERDDHRKHHYKVNKRLFKNPKVYRAYNSYKYVILKSKPYLSEEIILKMFKCFKEKNKIGEDHPEYNS